MKVNNIGTIKEAIAAPYVQLSEASSHFQSSLRSVIDDLDEAIAGLDDLEGDASAKSSEAPVFMSLQHELADLQKDLQTARAKLGKSLTTSARACDQFKPLH